MTKDWIHKMRRTKKLKLSSMNLFWHYSIVPFLLFGPMMATWFLFQHYILDTYEGVRTPFEIAVALYPWIIPAIIFYIIQRRRLRFKEIGIWVESTEFKSSVEETAKELKWQIDYYSDEFVRAHRTWNWSASWGEMITIIRDEDHILINSICDPNSWMSVSSWGWNKRNVKTFKDKIKASTQHRL